MHMHMEYDHHRHTAQHNDTNLPTPTQSGSQSFRPQYNDPTQQRHVSFHHNSTLHNPALTCSSAQQHHPQPQQQQQHAASMQPIQNQAPRTTAWGRNRCQCRYSHSSHKYIYHNINNDSNHSNNIRKHDLHHHVKYPC